MHPYGIEAGGRDQFMDFISPAYDVITNYIATSNYRGAGPQPLVIRGPVGGGNRGTIPTQNVEMAFFHTWLEDRLPEYRSRCKRIAEGVHT